MCPMLVANTSKLVLPKWMESFVGRRPCSYSRLLRQCWCLLQSSNLNAHPADNGPPLRVSYQRHAYELGEHYNSVVPAKHADVAANGVAEADSEDDR